MDKEEVENRVLEYYNKNEKYKKYTKQIDREKAEIYKMLEEYYEKTKEEITVEVNTANCTKCISAKRVQCSSVVFDAEKLERKIGKNIKEQVINKRYEIINYKGLVEYLKTCNVDPKKFLQFVNVEKTVNTEQLERFEELGKINEEEIRDCYKVELKKPYYKITKKEL